MGNSDLFCLGRDFDVETKKLSGTSCPELAICKQDCTLGRTWHIHTDRIRWCDSCKKWFHRACMEQKLGWTCLKLSQDGKQPLLTAEGYENADADEEENERWDEEQEVDYEENSKLEEKVGDSSVFLKLVAELPIERFRGPVRFNRTYELVIELARSLIQQGKMKTHDPQWRQLMLDQLSKKRAALLSRLKAADGFNDWHGIGVNLALSQLARAMKQDEFIHVIRYSCPECNVGI